MARLALVAYATSAGPASSQTRRHLRVPSVKRATQGLGEFAASVTTGASRTATEQPASHVLRTRRGTAACATRVRQARTHLETGPRASPVVRVRPAQMARAPCAHQERAQARIGSRAPHVHRDQQAVVAYVRHVKTANKRSMQMRRRSALAVRLARLALEAHAANVRAASSQAVTAESAILAARADTAPPVWRVKHALTSWMAKALPMAGTRRTWWSA